MSGKGATAPSGPKVMRPAKVRAVSGPPKLAAPDAVSGAKLCGPRIPMMQSNDFWDGGDLTLNRILKISEIH